MYIACSTITWSQARRQPDSPYGGPEGYRMLLDEVRRAGYSHVTVGGGARPRGAEQTAPTGPAGRGASPPAPAESQEQLALLEEHGLRPAPGGTGGYVLHDA